MYLRQRLLHFQVWKTITFVVLCSLPHFFEHSLICQTVTDVIRNTTDTCTQMDCRTTLMKSDTYRIVYGNAFKGVVAYVIPLVLLVTFSALVINKLYEVRGYRAEFKIKSEIESEIGISILMAVLITMLLVSQTSPCVNHILYYFIADKNYYCGHPYFYFYHVSNVVVSSNSCVNFVVYCIAGSKFREGLCKMTTCGKRFDGNPPQQRDSVTSSISKRVSDTLTTLLPI